MHASQCGLDDSHKGHFNDSVINIIRRLVEKENVVIVGDFYGHVGSLAEGLTD